MSLTTELLPFAEAIQAMRSRVPELPAAYYGQRIGTARAVGFSVAGLTSLAQIRLVQDSLTEAMESGEDFRSWARRVQEGEINLRLPRHRLDNIFRTNLQGAYSRGRCLQHHEVRETHPYLMYDAVNDSRTRPRHLAMDGHTAHADDPIWATWRPPNGFRCRCKLVALTTGQAQKRGIASGPPSVEPDKGWDYDPCDVNTTDGGHVEALIDKNVEELPGQVQEPVRRAVRRRRTRMNEQPEKLPFAPVEKSQVSDVFRMQIAEVWDSIPGGLQRLVTDNGYRVHIGSKLTDIENSLIGVRPRGHGEHITWDHLDGFANGHRIAVSEHRLSTITNSMVIVNRAPGVFRHEFGHAVETSLRKSGKNSLIRAAEEAYSSDIEAIRRNNISVNYYFLQSSGAGFSEAFAEMSGYHLGGGALMMSETPAEHFPRLLNAIQFIVGEIK